MKGQASLEILFAFMALLTVSFLILNSMSSFDEFKLRSEQVSDFVNFENAGELCRLGVLTGWVVKTDSDWLSDSDFNCLVENISKNSFYLPNSKRWFL